MEEDHNHANNGDGDKDSSPVGNETVPEMIDALAPILDHLSHQVLEYHRIKAPEIKRRQYNSFVVVFSITVAASALGHYGVIDGSAAMVIFGAVLYYIFRNNTQHSSLIDGMTRPKS